MRGVFQWLSVLGLGIVLGACEEKRPAAASSAEPAPEPVPLSAAESKPTLEGSEVTIVFNRSALGVSTDKPLSRQAGTYDGVQVSMRGYVTADTGRFLVVRGSNDGGHKADLEWIPYGSILSVTQSSRSAKVTEEGPAQSWRIGALERLMGMASIPLKDLPQGELDVWLEKDGKKDFIDTVSIVPGVDQWLCVGVDQQSDETLLFSVISEESPGTSTIYLPTAKLTPFHKVAEPDHDWTKGSPIAVEGSGQGKVFAKLRPKQK